MYTAATHCNVICDESVCVGGWGGGAITKNKNKYTQTHTHTYIYRPINSVLGVPYSIYTYVYMFMCAYNI